MKRNLIVILFFCVFNNSCDTSGSCSTYLAKQQNCNIVVTDNINKSSHWGGIELINPKGNPENVPFEYYLINSPHD